MHNGVLCPVCASREEEHGDLKESDLPYGWGRVQGVLLLVSSLRFLDGEKGGVGLSPFDAALNVILGVCILRRNRLILPLVVIVVGLLVLNIIVGSLTHDRDAAILSLALPIWMLYSLYYYARRREFKRWL